MIFETLAEIKASEVIASGREIRRLKQPARSQVTK